MLEAVHPHVHKTHLSQLCQVQERKKVQRVDDLQCLDHDRFAQV